jgi:hypothetical protein
MRRERRYGLPLGVNSFIKYQLPSAGEHSIFLDTGVMALLHQENLYLYIGYTYPYSQYSPL